jgi:hypothetical protein
VIWIRRLKGRSNNGKIAKKSNRFAKLEDIDMKIQLSLTQTTESASNAAINQYRQLSMQGSNLVLH